MEKTKKVKKQSSIIALFKTSVANSKANHEAKSTSENEEHQSQAMEGVEIADNESVSRESSSSRLEGSSTSTTEAVAGLSGACHPKKSNHFSTSSFGFL